ncbi:MAG: tetratricopeptide repeat protein [Woeseiaceae bacterium]
MAYSRILACLVALALVSACSKQPADTGQAQSDTQTAEAPKAAAKADSIAAHDGGIPLSASDPAVISQYMTVRRLADRGDFIEANQAARKLTDEHPDFIGGWIMVGNTALSGEQFVKASRKAKELGDSGTKGEKIWASINMSFVTNDTEKGLKLGKKLVDAYPESPRAWIVYSGLLAGDNQHSDARAAGKKAIKFAPDQAVTHNNMGFSYLFNDPKDFTLAEQHFQHAIDLDAGEDNHQVNMGDVHRAMGNLEAARNDYSKALDIDAKNAVAAVKRGHVNSFLGNYDEARADYDTGIAAGQEGNKSTLANYRAFVNLHAGDHQAAVDELKRELDRIDTLEMPSDQKVGARNFLLTNISDICFNFDMLDDAQAAVTQLSASLAEAGANSGDENYARQQKATATFWEGKLAARQGDAATAQAKAEEFAALLADDDNSRKMERYHELLGLTALKQGDYDLAIEHYRQANLSTSAGGGDVKNTFMLAKALHGAGNSEEADELMNTVASWNFNSAWFAMLRKDAAGTS